MRGDCLPKEHRDDVVAALLLMTLDTKSVISDSAKQLDHTGITGLVTGQLDQDILIIVNPEGRGDGQRHSMFVNINPLPGCIMACVIGECQRDDNCFNI